MNDQPGRQSVVPLASVHYEDLVRRELASDLGAAGDLTTDAIVPSDFEVQAQIVTRQDGRVCGLPCSRFAFQALGTVRYRTEQADGTDVTSGTVLAELEGPARVFLSAERTALNLKVDDTDDTQPLPIIAVKDAVADKNVAANFFVRSAVIHIVNIKAVT